MKKSVYSSRYSKNKDSGSLFRGIWLRWEILTQSEKVICLGILLIPIWWVIGWSIVLLLWVVGIAIYEVFFYKRIRLKRPSISVITLLFFSFYRVFIYAINTPEIAPRALVDPFISWGSGGILLWYIETHNIRVRLQVAAWVSSCIICVMMLWWLLFHFVLSEPYYTPPRTLYALILEKGARYESNQFGSIGNFLVPYSLGEKGFGGFPRHTFFFPHPTISSFAIGFVGLMALDTKKRIWFLPILLACGWLILICQARNSWITLPIVIIIRLLITSNKKGGIAFLLALLAITTFVTISVPLVTDYITETFTKTVEVTANFRKSSTDVRNTIYLRTWESVLEEPFLGHGVNGPPILPAYDFARIGTESFILGTLLYKSGLLGTLIFMVFFLSFITQLYKTREDRPLCCFLMILYLSLCSSVTEFTSVEIMFLVFCTILNKPRVSKPQTFGNERKNQSFQPS
ncbi:MAG: O-antigen ligase family protein [Scytonema sp. PMC 1069.18]|nr:O-antigen ligase family protein [Scytonema sp. PMC 1069.18]MEC4887301.1 O-antigen ligase family protein [Scytonema sp. PMC 1070.18]